MQHMKLDANRDERLSFHQDLPLNFLFDHFHDFPIFFLQHTWDLVQGSIVSNYSSKRKLCLLRKSWDVQGSLLIEEKDRRIDDVVDMFTKFKVICLYAACIVCAVMVLKSLSNHVGNDDSTL